MIMRYDQDEKKYYTWSDDGSTVAVTKRVAKELDVDYHTLDGKEVFDQADNNEVYKNMLMNIIVLLQWVFIIYNMLMIQA